MTAHPLDRPIWSALSTHQSGFGVGGACARRFAGDISPFAAARDDSADSLIALAGLLPAECESYTVQRGPSPVPPGSIVVRTAIGVQMIIDPALCRPPGRELVPLGDEHAAEMLALATLTEPGPFLARTHRLGRFQGIFEGDRLAAMAGERLRCIGYTEVSAVCVHPDFRGRGYARILSQAVAADIAARGETPFLHSYASNEAAIALYRSLGFTLRTEMAVTVLRRG